MHSLERSSVASRPKRREAINEEPELTNTAARTEYLEEGITLRFLISALIITFGTGFQQGYNLGVVNAPRNEIMEWIEHKIVSDLKHHNRTMDSENLDNEATFIFSIIVSVYSLGGIFGGLSTYFWTNNIGVKKSILCSNIFVFIASYLMGFSKFENSFRMIIAGRFLMGANNAFCGGLVVLYLSEISPVHLRGTICSIYQLIITISIMISQFVSVDLALGTTKTWPLLFFLLSAVAIVQLILVPFCVDSPIYLYESGKATEAKEAMKKLHGNNVAEVKFAEMIRQVKFQKRRRQVRFHDIFTKAEYQAPLMISCVMMFAQQFTGINVIIYYSSETFYMIDLGDLSETILLVIGIVNVCTTIVSVALVDIVGRRVLLIFSFGAMFVDMLAIFTCLFLTKTYHWPSVSYISVVCIIMYVVFFASGAGSIPWFLYTELFLDNMRPVAASIAVPVNWLSNFIIGLLFLSVHKKLGPFTFFIFSVVEFVVLIYIIMNVPETKNLPVEDIATRFTPTPSSARVGVKWPHPGTHSTESATPEGVTKDEDEISPMAILP